MLGDPIPFNPIKVSFDSSNIIKEGEVVQKPTVETYEKPEDLSVKLLVIDVEAGGLDSLKFSILEMAAVVWKDGELIDQFSSYVREDEIIADTVALKINKIDLNKLVTEPSPKEVVEKLEEFIGKHFSASEAILFAGQNVDFDINYLKRLYRLAGKELPKNVSHRKLDTASSLLQLATCGLIPVRCVGLKKACEFFRVPINYSTYHTALGDAQITAHLITRINNLIIKSSK